MDYLTQAQVHGNELPRRIELSESLLPLDCRHIEAVRTIAAQSFPAVWSEKDFAYFLAHENRLCFGIFTSTEGEQRLRSFFLSLLVEGDLDIISFATGTEDRRLGLGERLIRHVCTLPQVHRAFLEVEVENPAAIALYQKVGFSTLGRRPDYYGPRRDAYLMRWERDDRS